MQMKTHPIALAGKTWLHRMGTVCILGNTHETPIFSKTTTSARGGSSCSQALGVGLCNGGPLLDEGIGNTTMHAGRTWWPSGRVKMVCAEEGPFDPSFPDPPPPLRVQMSGSLKGSGRGSERGSGGTPTHIAAKQCPQRTDLLRHV